MINWKWAELGRQGGMVVSRAPVSLTVQWTRGGRCTAQWWLGERCVLTVQPASA